MPTPTTDSKIIKSLIRLHIFKIKMLKDLLIEDQYVEFELELQKLVWELFNILSKILMQEVATEKAKRETKNKKYGKNSIRKFTITLLTGYQVKVDSLYLKKPPSNWQGSRHLIAHQWKTLDGYSLSLCDRVGMFSALSPSYDIANQILKKTGAAICTNVVYKIANLMAKHCHDLGEENLILSCGESLAGKRVVLSVDGGRTRTRKYTGKKNVKGNACYDTDWKEPKLFVITVLNKDGSINKTEKPIYGCRYSEEDMLDLLRRFLVKLDIEKASQIQLIADGAPWIWNNLKPMLVGIGVKGSLIVETLDYYHASEYVHKLLHEMPEWVPKRDREGYRKEFLNLLWNGDSGEIISICRKIFSQKSKEAHTRINYLEKHMNRTQYADFEKDGLMKGSGIVESAIRRVINLRFKSASTFWHKEHVEKMYFLRCTLLSKRWDVFMPNFVKSC